MANKVTLIDYKEGGNLFSVKNSLEYLGADIEISSDPKTILQASKIIFPGVGSFHKAMDQIKRLDLQNVIVEKANSNTPFLGICVGMQVLFNSGSEAHDGITEETEGLKILDAKVEKFPETSGFKIPQIGWNAVNQSEAKNNPLFKGIEDNAYFYFVHSYMVDYPKSKAELLKQYPNAGFTKTQYASEFISSYWNGNNLFACQFHPEKSAENGLKLLKNFIEL